MFSRDNRGDDLFSNSTFDTSQNDKIIIREKSAKKVRKRVKKNTKYKDIEDSKVFKSELKSTDRVRVVSEKPVSNVNYKADSYKLPRLSEINAVKDFDNKDNGNKDLNSKDAASDFRRTSADWRETVAPGRDILEDPSSKKKKSGGPSALQIVAVAMAIVLLATAIMTTNVYAKKQCAEYKANAFAKLTTFEDNTFEQIAEIVEDVEEPISFAEEEPEEIRVLSLILSSVEKDLKIKLVDDEDMLVKNVPWSVTIEDEDGNTSEEFDDDEDGIIHMTEVSAGDYSVTLNESDALAGYELPYAAQLVSVKAKVEYKVIANIKEEIKSEKEVNVAAEDTGGKQAADVETAPPSNLDTVEYVESTKTEDGEEYVEATPDLTQTVKIKPGEKIAKFLDKLKASVSNKFGFSTMAFRLVATEDSGAPSPASEDEPKHGDTPTSDGNGKHTYKCPIEDCEYHDKTEDCTDSGDGKCKCGYEIPKPECEHSDTKLQRVDNTHHNKICRTCETVLGSNTDCDFSSGDCVCGNKKPEDPKPQEEHKLSYSTNNDGTHKVTCSVSDCNQSHNKDKESCTYESGKCKYCGFTEKKDEASVSLDVTSISLMIGESYTIKATVKPSGSANFASSDDGIATVDANGKVTGVREGNATIYANANGKSATCNVIVHGKQEEASILISGSSSLKVGETTTITATITPSDKTIKEVIVDDTSIISASVDGKNVTVKGLKAGFTRLKVVSDNGKDTSVTIHVTSAGDGIHSDEAQLYDAAKNALYVYEDGTYRLAKYKDYRENPSQKFFRKQETFLYTGWQTIDGQKCYFDKYHNKVTGRQIIGGVEYDFGEDGTVSSGSGSLGIDVSKYQPSINWSAVKSSGVEYVIIRCGYRGSSTGVLIEDPYFKSHIKGAKAAGLKVGVYFFTTAVSEAEAVEEASMCAYLCNGYSLDFPIFIDCESSPRPGYNGLSAGERTQVIKAFCNTIRSAGYSAGIYANKTWLSSYMNAGELSGYKIWLAQYNQAGPTYSGKYDMWQYTSKGSVNGISGYVDMNKCYYK